MPRFPRTALLAAACLTLSACAQPVAPPVAAAPAADAVPVEAAASSSEAWDLVRQVLAGEGAGAVPKSVSIFWRYEGVDGESTVQGYDRWIEADAMTFATTRSASSRIGATATRELSEPSTPTFVLTKPMDKASPQLLRQYFGARPAMNSLVEFAAAVDGSIRKVAQFRLEEVALVGYDLKVDGHVPKEVLTLSFMKLELKVFPYDATGRPAVPISAGFDFRTGMFF